MIKFYDISCDAPKGVKKDDIRDETKKLTDRLGDLQKILYAEKKHSVLVVLQGMDASGVVLNK